MKRFVTFLKNQNIYPQFYYHFGKNKWLRPHHAISQRKKINNIIKGYLLPEDFILDSFCWGITKEGHSFWKEVHAKWKKYCEEKNIQQLKPLT